MGYDSQVEADLDDVMDALEKLDGKQALLKIYCEADDLLQLPLTIPALSVSVQIANLSANLSENEAFNEDLQHYASLVYSRLNELSIPDDVLFCTNTLCQEHKSTLDCYCQSICDCLIESVKMCIPTTTVCKRVAGGMILHVC